jgi:hypothetical protein
MKSMYQLGMIALAAGCLLAGATPAGAQTVQKVAVGEQTGYGLTYSLPETWVAVTVEAECTTVKAGKYAAYAERYLGVKDAAQSDCETWRILGVTLSPVAEADTARTYQIRFEKGSTPTCYLTDNGLLWSINVAPTDRTERPKNSETVVETPSRVQVSNSELLKAGSLAKQAEIAAGQVFRIRESRMDILTGEAENLPADGAAYKLVLEQLDVQEQAYLALFYGERTVRRVQRVLLFRPTSEAVHKALIGRFSKYYGFVDKEDLSGEPLTLSTEVVLDKRAVQEALEKQSGKKGSLLKLGSKGTQGVAFVSPGRARVEVQYQGRIVAEEELSVAQLGSVEQVSSSLFVDKKNVAKATFNPLTGAMNLYEQQ